MPCLFVQPDELAQQAALARVVELSAANEAQSFDADLVGAGALKLGIEVVLQARVAKPALQAGLVDGMQRMLGDARVRQQQRR